MNNAIAQKWIMLASMYDRVLNKHGLEIMVQSVSDLPEKSVLMALDAWARTGSRFPLPADIREQISPKETEHDIGRETASKIMGAISKHGWNNPKSAREMIGDIGWEVVTRYGGWSTICQEVTMDNKTIITAQIRDLASTLSKSQRREDFKSEQISHNGSVIRLENITKKMV